MAKSKSKALGKQVTTATTTTTTTTASVKQTDENNSLNQSPIKYSYNNIDPSTPSSINDLNLSATSNFSNNSPSSTTNPLNNSSNNNLVNNNNNNTQNNQMSNSTSTSSLNNHYLSASISTDKISITNTPCLLDSEEIGHGIPTPECLQSRKHLISQSKLATPRLSTS